LVHGDLRACGRTSFGQTALKVERIKRMTQAGDGRLVLLLMLGVAVVGSNSLALSPILNDVAADLAATPVEVARASAAYGGATALSALGLGPLVDRLGARLVLVRGLAVLAAAMLASAAAPHWAALAGAQALAGAAAGVVLPATYALATAVAPEGRGAEVLGRVLTGWSVSLVAGVPLSALLASVASWRASYLALAVPLAVAAWLLSRQALPARVEATQLARTAAGSRARCVAPAWCRCWRSASCS
jgi:predicted MFS family arabinose efflux permease